MNPRHQIAQRVRVRALAILCPLVIGLLSPSAFAADSFPGEELELPSEKEAAFCPSEL